jgi:hypothetical protein
MASSTPHIILLQTNGGKADERPIFEAVVHTAAVTPGDLLLLSASGVTPNTNAADVDAPKIFAIELPYLDPRISTSPASDTDYAVAAVARYIFAQPGDLVYGFIETGHAAVALGAALEASNIAGCLQAHSTGRIIGFAAEAVDNSGGGTPARIKVRIA